MQSQLALPSIMVHGDLEYEEVMMEGGGGSGSGGGGLRLRYGWWG